MKSPVYGSDFIAKFLTPAFIKVHTGLIARPNTAALAAAMLEGTKGGGKITVDALATGAAADGKFLYIPTPSNKIGVYFTLVSGTVPAAIDCDVLLEVLVVAGDTQAEIATKLYNVLSLNKEIEVTDYVNPAITYVCTQGGACDVPSEPDGGAVVDITLTAAGTGEWAKIGKLANDLGLEPSPNEVEDSELGTTVVSVGYELAANLMNVDQRNRENMYDFFDKRICDIAFFNPTDPKNPLLLVQAMTLNMHDAPFGETYQLMVKGKKTYTSPRNYIKLWTYNNQLPV